MRMLHCRTAGAAASVAPGWPSCCCRLRTCGGRQQQQQRQRRWRRRPHAASPGRRFDARCYLSPAAAAACAATHAGALPALPPRCRRCVFRKAACCLRLHRRAGRLLDAAHRSGSRVRGEGAGAAAVPAPCGARGTSRGKQTTSSHLLWCCRSSAFFNDALRVRFSISATDRQPQLGCCRRCCCCCCCRCIPLAHVGEC